MDRRVLAALLALAFLIPAVPATGQSYYSEIVLRVAVQDDIKSLNPLTVSDVWSWNVLQWIYDRPVQVDYNTSQVMPYIAIGSANISGKAESWADCAVGNFGYSPTSSRADASKQEAIIFYDFTNVTWHDGTPMTVRDVLFSFHLAGQVPEWSSSANPLKHLGGRIGSNYTDNGYLHITKAWESGNRAALRFQLQTPYDDFFKSTASPMLLPYHIWGSTVSGQNVDGAKIWYDPGYNASAEDAWKIVPALRFENNPPIGSGIMRFEFWNKGLISKISTFRNHFYGDDYAYKQYIEANFPEEKVKQPTIDAITFRLYRTAEYAMLALKNGDIDHIIWSIPPAFLEPLSRDLGITMYSMPESLFHYVGYNMRKPSFGYNATGVDTGKPLRQAIAHCIDRGRIITRLLLNMGDRAAGPVPPYSEWHNESVPKYAFDPWEAKRILADAEYKVKMSDGRLVQGDAAIAAAGPGNWWVNPDGSNIGSGSGGKIDIYTPAANYDPIRAQFGLMLAQQMRDVGLYMESVAMEFGSIVDRIERKEYDMYVLGWRTTRGDPTVYLREFYHSDSPLNYAGYRNTSFDNLIDLAGRTEDEVAKRQAIFDAQAAICHDLPHDILYFRRTILAARTDNLIGWVVQGGSIFNRASIVNLRPAPTQRLSARFMHPISAVYSNSTTPLSVSVIDERGNPMAEVTVKMDATIGNLSAGQGITGMSGIVALHFTAPYVPPTPENVKNGTLAFIQVSSATTADPAYAPARPRFILVTVYPEEARFVTARILADPDVIEDVGADMNAPGFAMVDVEVRDQDGHPVTGAPVNLSSDSYGLTITPAEAVTDETGMARFTVEASRFLEDDGSVSLIILLARVIDPAEGRVIAQGMATIAVVDVLQYHPDTVHYPSSDWELIMILLILFVAVPLAVVIALAGLVMWLRRWWRR